MKTSPFAEHFEPRPISTESEEQRIIDVLAAVVESLGSTVSPNTEVILHDIRNPSHSTHAIVNGHVTGRRLGDPIIAAPVDDQGLDLLYEDQPPTDGISASLGMYESKTRDGRRLKSSTLLLRNRQGKAFASICTNTDLTEFESLHAALQKLLGVDRPTPPESGSEARTVDEIIEEMVQDAVNTTGKPTALMDKQEKMQIVSELLRRGAFVIKGAVERVAHSLGVTRFTVYNYLDELGYPGGAKAASRKATGTTTKKRGTKTSATPTRKRAPPNALKPKKLNRLPID